MTKITWKRNDEINDKALAGFGDNFKTSISIQDLELSVD